MTPKVVALGGGHGLAASLAALRRVTDQLTAVVTVADDGGSSGRLRREFGCLPPGDLRMALSALCGDDDWGRLWREVVQHRFSSTGDLDGHAVGNLLIVALWELLGDAVAGLDHVARLLGAQGRVLPMSLTPIDIAAEVLFEGQVDPEYVHGQVEVATTPGRVVAIHLEPPGPPGCPEAVQAVDEADWVVLGPGSWFTSVLPHLLVPDLRAALMRTPAQRLVALNLVSQPGETEGFSPETHLDVLVAHAPDLRLDVVLADERTTVDPDRLRRVTQALGAELVLAPVAAPDGTPRHDPTLLGAAYAAVMTRGRIGPWR
ncbi:MAG: uridine diphosphate-N-acetylglucosamine-binding protein YvcK [Actinomycetia bacterium]|nr:uridine diphosphate-N-acetylglucosamine-binding protein YvcK [Actinomycetes bacterium]